MLQMLAQTAMVLCGFHGHIDTMESVSRRWGIPRWHAGQSGVCLFCSPPSPVHRCRPVYSVHRSDPLQMTASFSGLLGVCASGDVALMERVVTRFPGSEVWLSGHAGPNTTEVRRENGASCILQ